MKDRWCPYCSKVISLNESKCKYILEGLTREKFSKTRKVLDNGLELDGYCKKLKLAFEYQGEQHYEVIKLFQMDENKLIKRKEYDEAKVIMCSQKKINLIVIPYTETRNDSTLLNFIVAELKKYGYFNEFYFNQFTFKNFYEKLPQLIELKELAISKGGKLVSNEYLGGDSKLIFECSEGHKWGASPFKIKSGTWCPKCGQERFTGSRRKNIGEMKKYYGNVQKDINGMRYQVVLERDIGVQLVAKIKK